VEWLAHHKEFEPGKPWLLRFFDQIQFFPSVLRIIEHVRRFHTVRIRSRSKPPASLLPTTRRFDARDEGITAFKQRQQSAFEAERQRGATTRSTRFRWNWWRAPGSGVRLPMASRMFRRPATSEVLVEDGKHIEIGDALVIVESMKMEIPVTATARGIVRSIAVRPGQTLRAGDLVCVWKKMTCRRCAPAFRRRRGEIRGLPIIF